MNKYVLIGLGVVFFIGAFNQILTVLKRERSEKVKVEGKIVDYKTKRMKKGGTTNIAIIEYYSPFEGKKVSYESQFGTPTQNKLGEVKEITLYKNEDGTITVSDMSPTTSYIISGIFGLAGVVMTVIGILMQ